jgi:lysocardiolipin and lysophospholipid acyltransferase
MVSSRSCRADKRYGLGSVFFRSVPPPTVHMHLRLHKLPSTIPSLVSEPVAGAISTSQGLAGTSDARAFELWLRERWLEKEKRFKAFTRDHHFQGDGGSERIAIRQTWVSRLTLLTLADGIIGSMQLRGVVLAPSALSSPKLYGTRAKHCVCKMHNLHFYT